MKQTERTVLFWWGINEGLGADTAASHEHFARHTVFTPRLFHNYNRNALRGRQRAYAATCFPFYSNQALGTSAAWPDPPTSPPLTSAAPTRHSGLAARGASPRASRDRGGCRGGRGPCLPPQRGCLRCSPVSHTTATWEGKQKAGTQYLRKKRNLLISEREGHGHLRECFVTRALTLHVTAVESRAHRRVCRLAHSLSMWKTTFWRATAPIHFKSF